jgi:hypothetical protein
MGIPKGYTKCKCEMCSVYWVVNLDTGERLEPAGAKIYFIENAFYCEEHYLPAIFRLFECFEYEFGSINKLVSMFYRSTKIPTYSEKIAIFKRDGFVCAKCGSTERLEIDHIKPKSRGGGKGPENLQVLCHFCNRKKRNEVGE